ncbi:MAG: hypothetical protein NVSMB56_06450 [Pyrinomonadaceae bacterium]
MFELIYVFYLLPKRIKRLTRERERSALAWSMVAIIAWFGTELFVLLALSIVYAIVAAIKGWQSEPSGLIFLFYVIALVSAIGSAEIVCRVLQARPLHDATPPPPPPYLGSTEKY